MLYEEQNTQWKHYIIALKLLKIYNTRSGHYLPSDYCVFIQKFLNVFSMSAAAKKLIRNYTIFVNSPITELPIIQKLVHSFSEQINGLVSLW